MARNQQGGNGGTNSEDQHRRRNAVRRQNPVVEEAAEPMISGTLRMISGPLKDIVIHPVREDDAVSVSWEDVTDFEGDVANLEQGASIKSQTLKREIVIPAVENDPPLLERQGGFEELDEEGRGRPKPR